MLRPADLWPALLTGVGVAGTLDEVILHQLLRWHHLYSGGDADAGRISDGLFHAFSTAALVVGIVALARRSRRLTTRATIGGIAAGAGGFNLYDATIQHKLLRLHQVREETQNLLPYDLAFGAIALAALICGLLLLRGERPRPAQG